MSRPSNSLIIMAACAGAILIMIPVLINPSIVRIILSLLLVLLLPGYAMTIILFPRNNLSNPERLLLSIGLSAAVTVLNGFILNWTSWGLRPVTLWFVLLLWITLAAVVIILFCRPWWPRVITAPVGLRFNLRQWLLLALAAPVVITAIHVARAPAPRQGLEGYTLLWIQPTDAPDEVGLGVRSEEFTTTKYQIQFEVHDVIYKGPALELEPGETWEGFVRLPSDPLEDKAVTISLYRLDDPTEVYRHVIWWPGPS